jgi:pyruvate,water dikinase
MARQFVIPFSKIRKSDVSLVGGKTASLGEMYSIGLPVPNGFAITADAYRYFIKFNKLDDEIKNILKKTKVKNIKELQKAGKAIRNLIRNAKFPLDLEKQILSEFKKLKEKHVAVRSSATAEDLADASFAGQQETFLNVNEKNLLPRIRDCFASLFTDRAISYREDKKFDHFKIALSVAVQKQIFSKASGVMFTIDPDSGHKNFVVINASYGLGDYIVQGKVNPDEFWVFKESCKLIDKKLGNKNIMEIRSSSGVKKKNVDETMQKKFSLTDDEVEQLAKYGLIIENHYKRPMDIEFAKDYNDEIYILQARPETVHSTKKQKIYKEYLLKEKGELIAKGLAIGRKIVSGEVNVISDIKNIGKFKKGQILVTKMTDPDWEPIMKIAAGIITEEGGRTAHAAIVARELGIPAIVGVKDATKILSGDVTIDCTKEFGRIWKGQLRYEVREHNLEKIPKTKTNIFVNIGIPDEAIDVSLLPIDGVGLAREEFIISSYIGIHPLELIRMKKENIFIEKLYFGISKIAAAFYPRPVIIRFSDFKTNEYRRLQGGEKYEPVEENPMIGWRGAIRYVDEKYEPAFRLECRALKRCIDNGLTNIKVMVPFCRTLDEARHTLSIIRDEGLNASIGMMTEIPSNVVLIDKFSQLFDFFSIGSNDLTQLVLGVDRDEPLLSNVFDERNPAVEDMIKKLIAGAHKCNRPVGICGQAPSDYPDFVKFLIQNKIDSISVNPDVALQTKLLVAKLEKSK